MSAGTKYNDRPSFYPDNTGLQFDTMPRDVCGGRANYRYSNEVDYYSAKYVDIPWWDASKDPKRVSGHNNWLNWTHKIQPDTRFASISDKNAYLQHFPEVDCPWKFTEYIFRGTGNKYIIIEPPLYNPSNLQLINGIKNLYTEDESGLHVLDDDRYVGKISNKETDYEELFEPLYWYQSRYSNGATDDEISRGISVPGNRHKQENLEAGLLDANGLNIQPWTDPEAHPKFQNSFIRREIYAYRKRFNYKSRNAGVRLYRKDIHVECVDRGQHGNIPPKFLNMSSPKEWFEPSNLFRNIVVPKVVAKFGSPVYAVDDGIIRYETTHTMGTSRVYVSIIEGFSDNVSSEGQYFIFEPVIGAEKQQPRPGIGKALLTRTRSIQNADISSGQYIHKGCAAFVGDGNGCYCKIQKQYYDDGRLDLDDTKPNPIGCSFYSIDESESKTTIELYQEFMGVNSCPRYTPKGPVETMSFETTADSQEDYMGLVGAKKMSDFIINGDAAMGLSEMPFGSAATMGGMMLATKGILDNLPTAPVDMGDFNIRYEVSYDFLKVNSEGRKLIRSKQSRKDDYETYERGTGKFAFDSHDFGYGGVDTDHFSGTNLMSRHRFNHSNMHCYNPEKCNSSYGPINMASGTSTSGFCGVGDNKEYCNYYNGGCPVTEIPRRAREYDREYSNALNLIYYNFINSGLESFVGLEEHDFGNGVYAAIGQCSYLDSLERILDYPESGKDLYFYYDKSVFGEDRSDTRVFVHIEQYGAENDRVLMTESGGQYFPIVTSTSSLGNVPAGKYPWLVELLEDYVSPTSNAIEITNNKFFMGGRMPEYRDYSKMGDEILCPMDLKHTGIYGIEASGKGGNLEDTYEETSKTLRGYRVDKTGEFIVDGRTIGEPLTRDDDDSRGKGPPSIIKSATPISGVMGVSVITSQRSLAPLVQKGWIYSSDTRSLINEINNPPDVNGVKQEGGVPQAGGEDNINLDNVAPDCLPTERDYYVCPKCNLDVNGNDMYSSPEDENLLNFHGEPLVRQIVTDWEFEHNQNCVRCGETLIKRGTWTHFPSVKSAGIVNVFGLPGQVVRGDGIYWKNHTEISRTIFSEIKTKIGGGVIGNGGGAVFQPGNSVDSDTETQTSLPFPQKGRLLRNGAVENDSSYENMVLSARDIKMQEIKPTANLRNSYKGDGEDSGKYNDALIQPYKENSDGLDMITINHLKTLRNHVLPLTPYPLFSIAQPEDYVGLKHKSKMERYKTPVAKEIKGQLKGISPFILAATETGGEGNYTQFWDGTVYPGKVIRVWYPPSKLWWFRKDLCGIISRQGGTDGNHFDDSTSSNTNGGYGGYVGNVTANSYHFLHGWVPLDKEVEKVFIETTPVRVPDHPMVGTTWSGLIRSHHYHAFLTNHEGTDIYNDSMNDKDSYDWTFYHSVEPQNFVESSVFSGQEDYTPYLYDRKMFGIDDTTISKYFDDTIGYSINQEALSWDGFGEDIMQLKNENALWKTHTYEEFQDNLEKYTLNGIISVVGDYPQEQTKADFAVMHENITNKYFNDVTQPITGYFDYGGLNSSNIYERTGPQIVEKTFDTDWANSGQIIIQSDSVFPQSADATQGSTGGGGGGYGVNVISREMSAMGKRVLIDVTDTVKPFYDERIMRVFKLKTGIGFDDLEDYIRDNKINAGEENNPPKSFVNDRYSIPGVGYWLNNANHYPKLNEFGELRIDLEGDEYSFDPMGMVDHSECGRHDFPALPSGVNSFNESDVEFYKHSPLVLCQSEKNAVEHRPSTSGMFVKNNNIEWQNGEEKSYWISNSAQRGDSFFVINLMGFPTEVSRKPYRYESGSWNVSNAVCQNIKGCRIANRGLTVSDAIEWSSSVTTYGGFSSIRPSLTATRCADCGYDLTAEPEKTGAFYQGGDGITTVEYKHLPKRDCIITGFNVGQKINDITDYYCTFTISSKGSDDRFWTELLTVYWDNDKRKWLVGKYIDMKYVLQEHDEIPILKGVWLDAGVLTEKINGYNFIAPLASKIKCEMKPEIKNKYRAETLLSSLGDNNGYLLPIKYDGMLDGDLSGGFATLELANDFNNDLEDIVSIAIQNNTSEDITISADYREHGKTKCRIRIEEYTAACAKFEVYGYELSDEYIQMTNSSEQLVLPIPYGAASVYLPDKPSKILSVQALVKSCFVFNFVDRDNKNNCSWRVKKIGDDEKYSVVGGDFFFDIKSGHIFVPTKIKDESGKELKISSIYDDVEIRQDTVVNSIFIKYLVNNGVKTNIEIESIGEGPSYIVEKDCILGLVGHVLDKDYGDFEATSQITESGMPTPDKLPDIGNSIMMPSMNKRIKMDWMVCNREKTNYKIPELSFSGLELGSSANKADFDAILGGATQEKNGFKGKSTKLYGKTTGEISLFGLPNTILSGNVYVYAPKEIEGRRTGGLSRTGFMVDFKGFIGGRGRKGVCFSKPNVYIYLREK